MRWPSSIDLRALTIINWNDPMGLKIRGIQVDEDLRTFGSAQG